LKKLNRREFMGAAAGLGAAFLTGCAGSGEVESEAIADRRNGFELSRLAVANGTDAAGNTRAAIESLGGMKKLVRSGDFVVIKPNISWNRPPEAAATTNPEVVAEIVRMCKEAGAGRILVIDHIADKPTEAVIGFTGVGPACEKSGAEVRGIQNESDYRAVDIPKGKVLKADTCAKDILKADVFINVPIAKSHSCTKLTMGMKNLMGCNWDRQSWHTSASLDQCIADYVSAIRPDLTVLDANRVLLTNGPKGPGETKDTRKVIAGADPVAVDAMGATLFDLKPSDVAHIKLACEIGAGEMDLKKIKVTVI